MTTIDTAAMDAVYTKMIASLDDAELAELHEDNAAFVRLIEAEQTRRRGYVAFPGEDES